MAYVKVGLITVTDETAPSNPSSGDFKLFVDTNNRLCLIDSAGVNTLLPGIVVNSAQFDKTNSSTLSDVTGLSHTLVSGKTYAFEAVFNTAATNGQGIKFALGGTAIIASARIQALTINNALTPTFNQASGTSLTYSTAFSDTATTSAYTVFKGTVVVTTGGTLTLQFAQGSALLATTANLLAGGSFKVTQIN